VGISRGLPSRIVAALIAVKKIVRRHTVVAFRLPPNDEYGQDYSKYTLEAAKVMRWTDPTIKLVANGSSNYGADWTGWNRTVLETLRDHIDYIAIHTYINNRADDFEQFMGWSERIDQYIETTAAALLPRIYEVFPLVCPNCQTSLTLRS
jgi:hypothetical protein